MTMCLNPQQYVKAFFTIVAYHKTYENAILHPLTHDYSQPQHLELSDSEQEDFENDSDNGEIDLEDKSVLPPATRRPTGRPKKRRIRSTCETETPSSRQHRQNKYGRCGGLGHSKRTCREAI